MDIICNLDASDHETHRLLLDEITMICGECIIIILGFWVMEITIIFNTHTYTAALPCPMHQLDYIRF